MAKARGKVITVAQQKGGAGKTTMAVQLATTFLSQGYKVATLDIDPQASLTQWYAQRSATLRDKNMLVHSPAAGWRLPTEVDRLAREFDIVIIDSPPHTQTEAKTAIRAADMVLIPVQPSPVDIWATKPTLQLAANERVPVLLILNRVPKRSNLARSMADKLAEYGAEIAETQLSNRVRYAESLQHGLGVVEMGQSNPAVPEMQALCEEVKTALVIPAPVSQKKAA